MSCCAHCGLPIPGASPTSRPSDPPAEPEFCCLGCRIAAEAAASGAADGELNRVFLRLGLSIFLSLNVMIFAMLLWTPEVYGDSASVVSAEALSWWSLARWASMTLSLPVLFLLGRPVAEEAWASLRRKAPSTDVLLIVGTAAAYAYSVVSTVRGAGLVYFEVGCAVLVLVTLGRWLEARGRQQAVAALDALERLLPDKVRRFALGAREAELVALDDVRIGDRLHVRAGERIPVDGRIVRGTASIDASLWTGESRAQIRETGDDVIGGTLNLDGDLTIEAAAPPRGGSWQRLIDCLREARQTKGRYQRLADRIAAWFLPAVAVTAAATFAYHAAASGVDHGLLAALAVVLIACPCALGLATPLAVWAALGTAARAQVLFRHGEALERLADVRAAAFDKTGTLTDGRPAVDGVVVEPGTSPAEAMGRAAALAGGSNHDLSRALVEYVRGQYVGPITAWSAASSAARTLPGRGLEAPAADGAGPVVLGNERLMTESGLARSAEIDEAIRRFTAAAAPIVCVGWRGAVRAVFAFREQLRAEAAPTAAACRAAGLAVAVLSGDHAARGRALAEALGVEVRAELLPADKVAALAALRRRYGPTAMVGDGINDAPALAAAEVGIALGCGADVSRQSADVCLLGDDLARIPWAVGLARRTITVVRRNLFWAFAYNVAGIGLAAAGRLNPVWAAAAMAVSGLSVTANSLRLAHYPLPDDVGRAGLAEPAARRADELPEPIA